MGGARQLKRLDPIDRKIILGQYPQLYFTLKFLDLNITNYCSVLFYCTSSITPAHFLLINTSRPLHQLHRNRAHALAIIVRLDRTTLSPEKEKTVFRLAPSALCSLLSFLLRVRQISR